MRRRRIGFVARGVAALLLSPAALSCSSGTDAAFRGPAIVVSGSLPVVQPPNSVGSGPRDELFVIGENGGAPRQLTHGNGGYDSSWSPDGRRVVFTEYDGTSGGPMQLGVGIVFADGSRQRTLPLPTGDNFSPAWSPDGRRIAFIHLDATSYGLAVADVGASTLRFVAASPAVPVARSRPSWSPDGKRIVFSVNPDAGGAELWTVGADGSGLARLTAGPCDRDPTWSPDGATIALDACDGNVYRIATVHADGTGRTMLTAGPMDAAPAWSPDGRSLAFSRRTGGTGPFHVYRMDVAAGAGSAVDITPDFALATGPSWRR